MTTSLTVPPVASFSRLMLDSDAERMAKRRWAVIDLFHGVGGADVTGRTTRWTVAGPTGDGLTVAPACRATSPTLVMPAASARSRTIRRLVRTALTGLRARFSIARRRSSRSLGTTSGLPRRALLRRRCIGVRSCISISIITPDAPSMVAWWYFVSSAHRPLSKPSMTYTSHSGRVRSIGRPTMRAIWSPS